MSRCCSNENNNKAVQPCVIEQGGCEVKSSWGTLGYQFTPAGIRSAAGFAAPKALPGEPTSFSCTESNCFESDQSCSSRAY